MSTTDIVPFRLEIPRAALDDLRDRLDRTRWPAQIPGLGWSRGVEKAYLQELAGYWRDGYDWRAQEAALNAFPQFTTQIDGTRIHFLHVRSARPDATPVILVHGRPGSIVEFLDLIGLLTAPADPADAAFHLVIPVPARLRTVRAGAGCGWDSYRIAGALAQLMDRLGYDRCFARVLPARPG
jgi:hypothetical protein